MSHRQFLVVARVGDHSLHPQWLAGPYRNFDVYLSYFGDSPGKYKGSTEFYEQAKGGKWPMIATIVNSNPELTDRYSAVWFPDDDLLMSTESINQMFNLFAGLGIALGQPALTLDSHVLYAGLIAQPHCVARYVNFIEIMAPIFSKDSLAALKHTFSQSPSGWGLDNLWPLLLAHGNMAVLDSTPMTHTRPMQRGELYKNNTLSPKDDQQKIADLYPHLAILPNGKAHKLRFDALLLTLKLPPFIAKLVSIIIRGRNRSKYKSATRWH